MNVNYFTQAYAIPNQEQQPALYGTKTPSPADSMSPTPSNVSPTSPRMPNYLPHQPNQYRQLRPQKTPLYVPAVLRPTEFPPKSPLTPPKSLHGSMDSLEGGDVDATLGAANSQLNLTMENDWIDDEELGEVKGPPSREHWKVCSNKIPF
jgi:hypothetical protein